VTTRRGIRRRRRALTGRPYTEGLSADGTDCRCLRRLEGEEEVDQMMKVERTSDDCSVQKHGPHRTLEIDILLPLCCSVVGEMSPGTGDGIVVHCLAPSQACLQRWSLRQMIYGPIEGT